MEKQEFNPKVDAYIAKAQPFAQPILSHIRELVHKACPEVEEAIKWSMPFFMVRGVILGHMAAFMAQRGALLVCGDAGDALGDSLYEARLYVRGAVAGLGADCIEKEMRAEHLAQVGELLQRAGSDDLTPAEFRRYGSARRLYNFHVDNAGAY